MNSSERWQSGQSGSLELYDLRDGGEMQFNTWFEVPLPVQSMAWIDPRQYLLLSLDSASKPRMQRLLDLHEGRSREFVGDALPNELAAVHLADSFFWDDCRESPSPPQPTAPSGRY